MRKNLLTAIAILAACFAGAQNLVPNPSFETYTSCPTSVAQVPLATPWINPPSHGGSADYFNTCGSGLVTVPSNFIGNETPATGNAYMGMCLYYASYANFREYIEIQLSSPLVAGQCYEVSFKYSSADGAQYATDRFGAYFSNGVCSGTGSSNPLPFVPQAANPIGNIMQNLNGWATFTQQFTAVGGESYMTLGNFYGDASTTVVNYNSTPSYSCVYLYVDDVSVTPCSSSSPLTCSPPTSICLGQSTTLTATGGTGTYTWSPTAGLSNPNSGTTTATPTVTTTYVVTSGPSTASVVVTVVPPPTVFAGNDTSVCSNQPVTFTAMPGGNSYLWSTGANTQSITVNTPGTYIVTATNAQGCSSSDTVVLANFTTPVVSLAGGGFCQGDSMTLNAGNPGCTYLWSTGDITQSITVYNSAVYTVTVTNTGGCSATASATVTVSPPPAAFAGNDTSVCNGQQVTFTALPAGNSYLWSNSAITQNISVTAAGTYVVTVTTPQGCSANDTVVLTTVAAPSVSLTGTGICPGGSTTIDAGNAGSSFLWNTGDTTQILTVNTPGTYSVVVTNSTGCTATGSVNIPNANTTVASAAPTMISCFGGNNGTATASGSGGTGPYSYLWNTTDTTATISNLVAGTYNVIVTDAAGCPDTTTVTITEPSQLTLQASAAPSTVCEGTPVTLTATPGGGTPVYGIGWMPGSMIGSPQTVTPTATTTYTALVTDNNGCTATSPVTVTVNPLPVAAFTSDTTNGCSPVCINFTDMSTVVAGSIAGISWGFGDATSGTGPAPSHCYNIPGTYDIVITVTTAAGCSATLTIPNYVDVSAVPVASFGMSPQPTTLFNAQIQFTDSSTNATSWLWSFGDVDSSSSTLQNPTFTYGQPVCYLVNLTVTSSGGCTDDTTREVCIDPDIAIYVPNAFTPNGTGPNDVFLPLGTGIDPAHYEMWIFDRWGNLIFHTTDLNEGWDGRVNGHAEIAQIDTYVWKINCKDIMGNTHALIGSVNLIK